MNVSKLAELRAKTDRELAAVIQDELDLGLDLVLLAAKKRSTSAADQARLKAENALKLLARVEDTSERQRLLGTLKHLQEALIRVSAGESCAQAAYS